MSYAAAPMLPPPPGLHDPRPLAVGRIYCGPWVVMALTGAGPDAVHGVFNQLRGAPLGTPVRGTTPDELREALLVFGWIARRHALADHIAPGRSWLRPGAFLRRRDAAARQAIWLVAAGRHWMLYQGRKATCSLLGGWRRATETRNRACRVTTLLELQPIARA